MPNVNPNRDDEDMTQAMTAAQRKAKERNDKREAGLRPIEIWCKPEHKQQFKDLEARLMAPKTNKV